MVNPPLKFVLVDANIYQNIYQNILEGWVEGVAIEHSVILWQARVLVVSTIQIFYYRAPHHKCITGVDTIAPHHQAIVHLHPHL